MTKMEYWKKYVDKKVCYALFTKRVASGIDLSEAIKTNSKPITHNNITYSSMASFLRHHNISHNSYYANKHKYEDIDQMISDLSLVKKEPQVVNTSFLQMTLPSTLFVTKHRLY